MEEQKVLKHCKKCQKELHGRYCADCGQPNELKRIDKKYIFNEIGSVLNFDKGIFYTIKGLLVRPGKAVKEFISEDRNRLVKPILFIILCSLMYTITKQFFHFEDGYITYSDSKETAIITLFEWVQNNYGYSNIIMGIFITIWIKILFRKYDYNFYEILILLCFIMGFAMLIYTVFGIFEGLTKLKVLNIAGVLGIMYCSWAIGQFFGKRKFINYLKAFFSYVLGMILFSVSIIILGLLIDFVK